MTTTVSNPLMIDVGFTQLPGKSPWATQHVRALHPPFVNSIHEVR